MSAIFGIFNRDGSPLLGERLNIMHRAMAHWGPCGGVWQGGPAGLGQVLADGDPAGPPAVDPADGLAFAAAGRVDNRAELLQELRIDPPHDAVSDAEIMRRAYRRWGEDCPAHIYGDWSLAAWQPGARRLFLARDHYGNTALYYYAGENVFAFAAEHRALLALNLAPITMDELYLAQVLVSWPAYHGERTVHAPLRRLPPAHTLAVTPERLEVRQYWFLEQTPELHLPCRQDYVEAFKEIFDQAVRARLRGGPLAVTLSGGLDSGSVTATAASMLSPQGQRLQAYTSVPLQDTNPYVGARFGDELPFAEATARLAGSVDLHLVPAAEITPLQGLRRVLEISNEPCHAAGNFYWMLALLAAAREQGCRALLTGQVGNAGISWTGEVFSQPLAYQLRQLGWGKWAKERLKHLKRLLPPDVLTAYLRYRIDAEKWYRASAIQLNFARRLDLSTRRLDENNWLYTPIARRLAILKPGASFLGVLWAEMGAAYGLDVRDPTADARVLAFTISVPDWVFIDPATGLDRWLIRQAMQGRLPEEVRLNRRRGRQAGDLVPRLRASAAEVDAALDELAAGPAAAYVDVPYMRETWQMIQAQDTPEAFSKAIIVLTRGLMAGLFVNQFYAGTGSNDARNL